MNIRDLEPPPLTVPLSVDGSEVLTFDIGGPSGWAALHSPDTARAGLVVLLRFGPESDDPQAPILVRELHVAAIPGGSAPLSSPLLRMLPLARMVAAVNRESIREQLRPMLMPWNVGQAQHVGSRLIRWQFQPDGPTPLPQPNLELEVPNDRRRPDEFYARVADTYLAQATISNRAAQDIAEVNQVPKSTVHRWLKEARTRGLLRLPQQNEVTNIPGGEISER